MGGAGEREKRGECRRNVSGGGERFAWTSPRPHSTQDTHRRSLDTGVNAVKHLGQVHGGRARRDQDGGGESGGAVGVGVIGEVSLMALFEHRRRISLSFSPVG